MDDERDPKDLSEDEIDAAQGQPSLAEDQLDDVSGGVIIVEAPGMVFHREAIE